MPNNNRGAAKTLRTSQIRVLKTEKSRLSVRLYQSRHAVEKDTSTALTLLLCWCAWELESTPCSARALYCVGACHVNWCPPAVVCLVVPPTRERKRQISVPPRDTSPNQDSASTALSDTPPPAQPPPPSQTLETQSHSAPTPLKRPMLDPERGPGPRVSA